jgi:hypothetical protein
VPIAIQLGFELWGSEEFEFADGTSKEELVFRRNVLFGGEKREVAIILTNAKQALIGMELLQTRNVLHEEKQAVIEPLNTGWVVQGPKVQEFYF